MADVRMQAPDNCAGVSLPGRSYVPGTDGLVAVDPLHVETLRSHGFTVAEGDDFTAKASAEEMGSKTTTEIEPGHRRGRK